MARPLRIGLIGYGFMGRAHANAYRKVNAFFDLELKPVLAACCWTPGRPDQSLCRELGL